MSIEPLAPSERKIFMHLVRGLSAKEIAAERQISIKTVDVHKSRIYKKLNVHTQCELIVLAYESGIVKPGSADAPTV